MANIIQYVKQLWDSNSFYGPTRMNHMEDGIKNNSDAIVELNSDLAEKLINVENIGWSSGQYPYMTVNKERKRLATSSDLADRLAIKSVSGTYYSENGLIGLGTKLIDNKIVSAVAEDTLCIPFRFSGNGQWYIKCLNWNVVTPINASDGNREVTIYYC